MAFKTITVSNVESFVEGESASITGKNGFTSRLGVIPMLCNTVSSTDDYLYLTIKGITDVQDLNHREHILAVNDGLVNVSVGVEEATPQSIQIKSDLSRVYILGDTSDTIHQYVMDVAGDISTARPLKNPLPLGSVETILYDLTMSGAGSHLYIAGDGNIHQYRLATPWETETAKYVATKTVGPETQTPYGLALNRFGNVLFVCDSTRIYTYNLPYSWDIRKAVFSHSNTGDSIGQGFLGASCLRFDVTGSNLYVLATSTTEIYQYQLSTPFTINTASWVQTFNVSDQESNPASITFSETGRDLFVLGTTSNKIYQYNLTTPWNVSTAQFVNLLEIDNSLNYVGLYSSPTKQDFYTLDADQLILSRYKLANTDNISTGFKANVSLNLLQLVGEGQARGLNISSDGSNVYAIGNQFDRLYQFSLNTAYDFSEISSIQNYYLGDRELLPTGMYFKPDGKKVFIIGKNNLITGDTTVYSYDVASWNVATLQYNSFFSLGLIDNDPTDISFSTDGTKMYVVGGVFDTIYQYTLPTAWDINSAFYSGKSKNLEATSEIDPTGLVFNTTGTRLYVTGTDEDKIFQLSLGTAWDISTANYGENSFNGIRGSDYITIPINQRNEVEFINELGYNEQKTKLSVPTHSYNETTGVVTVVNEGLSSALPSPPFLVELPQSINYRYFDARSLYLEGTRKTIEKNYDITGKISYTANLGVIPSAATFIKAYEDGEAISFIWDGMYNITVDLNGLTSQLKSVVDYYTVPAIEANDTISLYSNFTYRISNTSYSVNDPEYSPALTANAIYRVVLDRTIDRVIQTGSQAVNISPDLFGTIGNVNTIAKSFTIDYDNSKYTGTFNLANYKIYSITSGSTSFKRANLGPDRVIRDVRPGFYIFKGRNKSSYGRASPFTSAQIQLKPLFLGKVTDLALTEEIFIDTGQAASVRGVVSFTPVQSVAATAYEISYKFNSLEGTDLYTFNTVTLSKAGIDENGKIKHTINNIDRGFGDTPTKTITVRVTPINNDLRGIPAEITQTVIGKSIRPKTVINFRVRQFQDNLYFNYEVPKLEDGITPVDLDLNYIDIRRIRGACSSPSSEDWNVNSTKVLIASTPSTGAQSFVDIFGTHTFLAKTIDTSSIFSEDIAAYTITLVEPNDVTITSIYSESDPSANNVSEFIDNTNYTEYFYPSFSNSNNGGLSSLISSSVDNANGTSTGFTQGSDEDFKTLFTTGNLAVYQTQVRSQQDVVSGIVKFNYLIKPGFAATFNDLKTNIVQGTSCVSSSANVFIATGIGSFLSDAIYNNINRTLSNAGSSGSIFAIWNTNTNLGNSNSYALIAGVIDSNTLSLGETYFANGSPTHSNLMPNLTTAYQGAFSLVDLTQYVDDPNSTFLGNPGALTDRLYIRYSSDDNPFYANNNVSANAFTAWELAAGSLATFKHFQLKLEIENSEISTTYAELSDFNYYVQLQKKSYQAIVEMNTNPKIINYSSANFTIVPEITGIVPINVGYAMAPEVISANTTAANVRIFKVSDGTLPTGFSINFRADGA